MSSKFLGILDALLWVIIGMELALVIQTAMVNKLIGGLLQ